MAPRPSLERLTRRPLPSQWACDELVSLAEAAALFFPDGPMTANALRIAFHRGELPAVEICGKLFTTPRDVLDLVATRRAAPRGADVAATPDSVPAATGGRPLRVPREIGRRIAAARRRRRLP